MAKRGRPPKNNPETPKAETPDEIGVEEAVEVTEEATTTEGKAEVEADNTSPPNERGGTSGGYNPFAENIVERDYSTPKVAEGIIDDIDEPDFRPPSYEDIISDRQEVKAEDTSSPFDQPNPAINDLDYSDKKIACESLVDTCLDAYEEIHKVAVHFAKVDEDDLMQRQIKGKLDLSELIPVEDGEITISEFVEEYNTQCEEALSYDKDFGYKVRPALIRVFLKHGWGLTDEQFLAVQFGKEIVTKITVYYSLKKTINATLRMLEHNYKQNQKLGYSNTKESEIIEDEPEIEPEIEPQIEIISETPKKKKPKAKSGTQKFNIDYPQNPKDKMAEHPTEIQNEIKKGKKKKK